METTVTEVKNPNIEFTQVRSTFTPQDGYYHLIEVNALGNEIPGTETCVSPKMYNKVYISLPNFKIKSNSHEIKKK